MAADPAMSEPTSPDLSRYSDWRAWLQDVAAADDDVLAVFVGGSAATGGWDEWSDLDVEVLTTPGTVDAVYDRLLDRALSDFDACDLWELPATTWPDGRQAFVSMQSDPGGLEQPVRLIDLHLSDLSDARRRVDPRRHGVPIVLHDPEELVEVAADDGGALAAGGVEAVEQARQRRLTGEWLVNRALRRGDHAEAVGLHLRFGVAAVVQLLRLRERPWRHDFGLRYLDDDLGAALARRVGALLPGDDLGARSAATLAWLDDLLGAVEPVCWPEPGGRVWLAAATDRTPAEVWAALTDPASVAAWLGRVEGTIGASRRFWVWHDDVLPSEHRVLAWEPGRLLRWSWEFPDEPASEVTFRIDERGRLGLGHSGLADPASYAAGWQRHVTYLLAHLAGRDLPWEQFETGWDARLARHRALLQRQAQLRR